jgi:hypothetical protein
MCVANPSAIRWHRGLTLCYLLGKAVAVGPYLCSIICCEPDEAAEIGRVPPPPPGTIAAFSNAHDFQIANSTIAVAGRDYNVVHNHNHNVHYHSNLPLNILRAVLHSVPNFRRIYQDMLSKATTGTGVWLLKGDKFRLWLEPNGDIKILWGSGMRTLPSNAQVAWC